jgi:predicted transcriptional regulator
VSLFRKPTSEPLESLTDAHLFALTALAQHGALHPEEVADVINAEPGFCEMAMNHFEQVEIVEKVPPNGRYTLSSLYFRPVVNHLSNSNFLWM